MNWEALSDPDFELAREFMGQITIGTALVSVLGWLLATTPSPLLLPACCIVAAADAALAVWGVVLMCSTR